MSNRSIADLSDRDLDHAVHAEVMGGNVGDPDVPLYSTDWTDVRRVLDRAEAWRIHRPPAGDVMVQVLIGGKQGKHLAPTVEEAVCKAALKACNSQA
jgi:hypothetical protein